MIWSKALGSDSGTPFARRYRRNEHGVGRYRLVMSEALSCTGFSHSSAQAATSCLNSW